MNNKINYNLLIILLISILCLILLKLLCKNNIMEYLSDNSDMYITSTNKPEGYTLVTDKNECEKVSKILKKKFVSSNNSSVSNGCIDYNSNIPNVNLKYVSYNNNNNNKSCEQNYPGYSCIYKKDNSITQDTNKVSSTEQTNTVSPSKQQNKVSSTEQHNTGTSLVQTNTVSPSKQQNKVSSTEQQNTGTSLSMASNSNTTQTLAPVSTVLSDIDLKIENVYGEYQGTTSCSSKIDEKISDLFNKHKLLLGNNDSIKECRDNLNKKILEYTTCKNHKNNIDNNITDIKSSIIKNEKNYYDCEDKFNYLKSEYDKLSCDQIIDIDNASLYTLQTSYKQCMNNNNDTNNTK